MIRNSITDEITAGYVDKYLEKSSKLLYTDLQSTDKLVKVLYKDLANTAVNGYPIASDYIDDQGNQYSVYQYSQLTTEQKAQCQLRYYYLPYSHEIYIGTTGSGKTTGCIEPQIRAISSQKNKPNLFITDPKGELYQHNARHLEQQGYAVYVLNFKDITRSNQWNPLLEIYNKKMSIMSLGSTMKYRTGAIDSKLRLNAHKDKFRNNAYIEYNGFAFPDGDTCDYYVSFQKDYIEAEIDALVDQFADNIITVASQKDPTWEQGAQQLLKGIIFCMLDDAVKPNSGFTKDMMTIRTIQQYYRRLRHDIVDTDTYTFEEHPLLKDKSIRSTIPLKTAFKNANNTMLSYCGVFDTATKKWFQGHIFALTSGDSINIEEIGDRPYAIFVITRDYDKSDFTVAGMFIDWVYKVALQKAENSKPNADGTTNTRPIHFLLEEFGNIPEIRDFENKIATSRSRNIWFHLVVQSYEQISIVYDKGSDNKRSTVICDNCNAQIFLGAQSRATKEKFSQECGKMWVPSLASTFSADDTSLTDVMVLPVSDLDLIETGEMYIKRLYTPVIKSQYIRSYMCANDGKFADFYDNNAYDELAPINICPFNAPKYTYKPLSKNTTTRSKNNFADLY